MANVLDEPSAYDLCVHASFVLARLPLCRVPVGISTSR